MLFNRHHFWLQLRLQLMMMMEILCNVAAAVVSDGFYKIVKQVLMQSDGIPWWDNISFHFSSNHQASIPVAAKLPRTKYIPIHMGKSAHIVPVHANRMELACRVLENILRYEDQSTWWGVISSKNDSRYTYFPASRCHTMVGVAKVMSIWMKHIFGFLHQIVHQTPFISFNNAKSTLLCTCCVCACLVLSHCSRYEQLHFWNSKSAPNNAMHQNRLFLLFKSVLSNILRLISISNVNYIHLSFILFIFAFFLSFEQNA